MLSWTKAHFYIINWPVRVAVTALFAFWFDKQTFGLQKCSMACFGKRPLIMIDKFNGDDTTVCLVWL